MEQDTDSFELEQTQKPVKTDFKSILAGVSELNKKQIQKIYVPTICDYVSFKPLTIKQQKTILSSGVDTQIENMSFSNTMNDIILENCLSSKNKIKSIDKPLILLQLRQHAAGDVLVIKEDEQEYKINIADQVDRVKEAFTDKINTTFESTTNGVTITGEAPDLSTDTKFNKQFTQSVKKSGNTRLKLTDVVGDIYIHEMVKYVKSVSLGDNQINTDDLSVSQTIELFENLPMNISNSVATKIKQIREIEIQSLSSDVLPEGVQIGIDASLFTGE